MPPNTKNLGIKWSKSFVPAAIADAEFPDRRWRGPALGGRLQRGMRFCFSAHDGEATTPTLTEWARPEIVHAGRRPTATQMVNQARALRSIGAKKVRRAGNGWVWRLSDNEGE